MIKCCNCEEIFETENDLSTIVEVQELVDGEWQSTDRFVLQGPVPEDTKTVRYAVFKADGTLTKQAEKAYDKLVNILAYGTTQGFVEKRSIDLLDGWMDDVIRNEI